MNVTMSALHGAIVDRLVLSKNTTQLKRAPTNNILVTYGAL